MLSAVSLEEVTEEAQASLPAETLESCESVIHVIHEHENQIIESPKYSVSITKRRIDSISESSFSQVACCFQQACVFTQIFAT